MKILVVNCGSSSLKYQLINMDNDEVIAKGNYERIGMEGSFLTHKFGDEKKVYEMYYEYEEPIIIKWIKTSNNVSR